MLLGLTTLLFADTEPDVGVRIAYAVGYGCGAMLCPGFVFLLLFCLRGMRSTAFAFLWYLGLLLGGGILLLTIAGMALRPDLLSPPANPAHPIVAPLETGPASPSYLTLTVPDNAEVVVNGARTTQRGAKREFVSPPLAPGVAFNYTICVRYTNRQGQAVEDTRAIPIHANDRLTVDFTHPTPRQ